MAAGADEVARAVLAVFEDQHHAAHANDRLRSFAKWDRELARAIYDGTIDIYLAADVDDQFTRQYEAVAKNRAQVVAAEINDTTEKWLRDGQDEDRIWGQQRANQIGANEERAAVGQSQVIQASNARRKIRWVSDPNCCPQCAKFNGKVRVAGKSFGVIGGQQVYQPPAHPNCRCAAEVVQEGGRSLPGATTRSLGNMVTKELTEPAVSSDELLQQGIRDQLAERFVRSNLRKYPSLDHDEALSAAYEGLVLAADTYDPASGAKFETWAWHKMRGAVHGDARKERRRGQAGTLDTDVETTDDPSANMREAEQRESLEDNLVELPANLRRVVEARYVDGMTLEEVAAELGVTKGRAWQLEKQALETLRERMKSVSKSGTYYDNLGDNPRTEVVWWINDAGNIQTAQGSSHPEETEGLWSGRFIPETNIVAVRETDEQNMPRKEAEQIIRFEFPGADIRYYGSDKSVSKAVGNEQAEEPTVIAAGLAVVADDTGRVLMLQRHIDEDAGGLWELPGGHIDDGEEPFQAAYREWREEVGCDLSDAPTVDEEPVFGWAATNGKYEGFVLHVPTEASVDLNSRDLTSNPDGDEFEAVAWVDPADFESHNLRPELLEDVELVREAIGYEPEMDGSGHLITSDDLHKASKGRAPYPKCGSPNHDGWLPPDFESVHCTDCGKLYQPGNGPKPKSKSVDTDEPTVIAVDFNGTLASGTGPNPADWGEPVEGAKEAMEKLKEQGYAVAINTCIGDDAAVAEWLEANGIPYDTINESPAQPDGTSDKLYASAYIDDRAVHFNGSWEDTLKELFCNTDLLQKSLPLRECPSCGSNTKAGMTQFQVQCTNCDWRGDKCLRIKAVNKAVSDAEVRADEEAGDFLENPEPHADGTVAKSYWDNSDFPTKAEVLGLLGGIEDTDEEYGQSGPPDWSVWEGEYGGHYTDSYGEDKYEDMTPTVLGFWYLRPEVRDEVVGRLEDAGLDVDVLKDDGVGGEVKLSLTVKKSLVKRKGYGSDGASLMEKELREGEVRRPGSYVSSDDETWSVVFRLTDKTLDRDTETVNPLGGDFSDFARNAVCIWNHQTDDFPLGMWHPLDPAYSGPPDLWVEETENGPALFGRAYFSRVNPQSRQAYEQIKEGSLKGCSISFLPKGNVGKNSSGGAAYEEWTLLEISVCPIGSNSHALVVGESIGKGLRRRAMRCKNGVCTPVDDPTLFVAYAKRLTKHGCKCDGACACKKNKAVRKADLNNYLHDSGDDYGAAIDQPVRVRIQPGQEVRHGHRTWKVTDVDGKLLTLLHQRSGDTTRVYGDRVRALPAKSARVNKAPPAVGDRVVVDPHDTGKQGPVHEVVEISDGQQVKIRSDNGDHAWVDYETLVGAPTTKRVRKELPVMYSVFVNGQHDRTTPDKAEAEQARSDAEKRGLRAVIVTPSSKPYRKPPGHGTRPMYLSPKSVEEKAGSIPAPENVRDYAVGDRVYARRWITTGRDKPRFARTGDRLTIVDTDGPLWVVENRDGDRTSVGADAIRLSGRAVPPKRRPLSDIEGQSEMLYNQSYTDRLARLEGSDKPIPIYEGTVNRSVYAAGYAGYHAKAVNPYVRPGCEDGSEWLLWRKGYEAAEADTMLGDAVNKTTSYTGLTARQRRDGSFGLFDTVQKCWVGDGYADLKEAEAAIA